MPNSKACCHCVLHVAVMFISAHIRHDEIFHGTCQFVVKFWIKQCERNHKSNSLGQQNTEM